jgi:hypothetical protein
MPIAAAAWRGSRSRSMSQTATWPEVLITSWARMLISVDFPAPFEPSRANKLPRGISRSTASSAFFGCAVPFEGA